MKQDIYKHLEAVRDLCTEAEAVSPELLDSIMAVHINGLGPDTICRVQIFSPSGDTTQFVALAKQALHINYNESSIRSERFNDTDLELCFNYKGIGVFTIVREGDNNGLE